MYQQISSNSFKNEITDKLKVSSKIGDHSRGWPEDSLFDTNYNKV